MAWDFPNSPAEDQQFTAPNGYVYTFNTPAWRLTYTGAPGPPGPTGPTGGAQFVTISDSQPATPVVGQMWWNSSNGNLFIYYNDGSSYQWVQVNNTGVL